MSHSSNSCKINLDAYVDVMTQDSSDAGIHCDKFATCKTRRLGALHKKDVIEVLTEFEADVTHVTAALNVTRSALLAFIRADVELTTLYNDLRETRLDRIESVVFTAAEMGDLATGRFLLKHLRSDAYASRDTVETVDRVSIADIDLGGSEADAAALYAATLKGA